LRACSANAWIRAMRLATRTAGNCWRRCAAVSFFVASSCRHRCAMRTAMASCCRTTARHRRNPSAARFTVHNGESDLHAPLPELCARRRIEADRYLAAMRSGDSTAALRDLNESGAPARILAAAREEAARERISDELASIADPSLLMMLRIMERLIARCHHKACAVARADR
jgi:hypothetical protein